MSNIYNSAGGGKGRSGGPTLRQQADAHRASKTSYYYPTRAQNAASIRSTRAKANALVAKHGAEKAYKIAYGIQHVIRQKGASMSARIYDKALMNNHELHIRVRRLGQRMGA